MAVRAFRPEILDIKYLHLTLSLDLQLTGKQEDVGSTAVLCMAGYNVTVSTVRLGTVIITRVGRFHIEVALVDKPPCLCWVVTRSILPW